MRIFHEYSLWPWLKAPVVVSKAPFTFSPPRLRRTAKTKSLSKLLLLFAKLSRRRPFPLLLPLPSHKLASKLFCFVLFEREHFNALNRYFELWRQQQRPRENSLRNFAIIKPILLPTLAFSNPPENELFRDPPDSCGVHGNRIPSDVISFAT